MKINLVSCANLHTGIGRYSQELHKEYLNLGFESSYVTREKVGIPFSKKYFFPLPKNYRNSFGPFFLKAHLTANKRFGIYHADYVDSGSVLKKTNFSVKLIVTVHDAIPFIYPKNKSFKELYIKYLNICSDNADSLIVVSQVSKDDLLRYTSIDESKIIVIYNGINHTDFYPNKVQEKRNDLFTIRYHGGISTGHKNTQLLLETAYILEQRNIDFKLEISGAHPHSTTLPKLLRELNLKNVSFTGFFPNNKLRTFLSETDLFLYPSLYEGFGFPPLEAMACGTPVLSSNRGSLNEILKGAAVLSEPNAEAFASEIENLINNSVKLKELRKYGLEKASEFSWQKCAQQTLETYKN